MSLGDELPPTNARTARVQLVVTCWDDSKVSDGINVEKERYETQQHYRDMIWNLLSREAHAALSNVLLGREAITKDTHDG